MIDYIYGNISYLKENNYRQKYFSYLFYLYQFGHF